MYAIFVTAKVRPERREAFLDVIQDDATCSVRDEPGCVRFEVFESRTDRGTYHFLEVYRDEDAFRAHQQTPHFERWREASGGLLQEPTGRVTLEDVFPRLT